MSEFFTKEEAEKVCETSKEGKVYCVNCEYFIPHIHSCYAPRNIRWRVKEGTSINEPTVEFISLFSPSQKNGNNTCRDFKPKK